MSDFWGVLRADTREMIIEELKNWRPDLRQSTGAIPSRQLPAAGNTGSGYTPALHAASHQHGGSDEIATVTAGAYAIPMAGAGGTLASGWIPAISLSSGVTGILPVANGGTGTGTAFTAGSIVFAGVSGVYSEDNARLYWDNVNHRLGLNNNAPADAFDVTGNVRLTGLGRVITADLSNPTHNNRMRFQTAAANTSTTVGVAPAGSAVGATFSAYRDSDLDNTSIIYMRAVSTSVNIGSTTTGSGTLRPITFLMASTEIARLDTSGQFGLGLTSLAAHLDVGGTYTAAATRVRIAGTHQTATTGTHAGLLVSQTFDLTASGAVSPVYGVRTIPAIISSTASASVTTAGAIFGRFDPTGIALTNGRAFEAGTPTMGVGATIATYTHFYGNVITANTGSTGTHTTYGAFFAATTSVAGAGGTMTNHGVGVTMATASSAGTTNYGLRITGTAGALSTNWGIYDESVGTKAYFRNVVLIGRTSGLTAAGSLDVNAELRCTTFTNGTFTGDGTYVAIAPTVTNVGGTPVYFLDIKPIINHTSTASRTTTSLIARQTLAVSSGVTNSGGHSAMYAMATRLDAADQGTLASLIGLQVDIGNVTGMSGTTTTAYGINILPYAQAGTITTMYDLRAAAPATGGTLTTQRGVWIEGGSKVSYFEGPVYHNRITGLTGAGDVDIAGKFRCHNSSGSGAQTADVGALAGAAAGWETNAQTAINAFRTSLRDHGLMV